MIFCASFTPRSLATLGMTEICAPRDVLHGIPGFTDDPKRVIAATVGVVRIVCLYAPN